MLVLRGVVTTPEEKDESRTSQLKLIIIIDLTQCCAYWLLVESGCYCSFYFFVF